jgi:hypothetical protein
METEKPKLIDVIMPVQMDGPDTGEWTEVVVSVPEDEIELEDEANG